MSFRAILVLFLLAGTVSAATPADAHAAATADLVRYRPIEGRSYQRYLWLPRGVDVKAWGKVLDFWANSLSKEADLTPLARVRPDLFRLDLRDYGMDARVWERLAEEEPYFHAKVKLGEKEVVAQAPWLDGKLAASLVAMAQSEVPIVRGDWWLVYTGQQAERKAGYYDFLGVKNRQEFQARVGLDQKLAEKLQKEIRSIVSRSGVALNNRQIIRYASITGSYWVTLDSFKSTGKNNAVRLLNGDYRHDAEEIYGTLPNGLFAFFLSDDKGVRQDSAPDTIASDGLAPGNDRRVHVGVSCVRCHVEGIRPIQDWARRVYRGPLALASPDYEKLKRLRRLYLSDLERWLRRDQADYAETLLRLTGLKSAEMARLFGRLHASYEQADLTAEDIARDAGVTVVQLLAALKAAAKTTGNLDPVLAGLLQDPPETVRREHLEEVWSLLMSYIKGYVPLGGGK